MSEAKSCEMFSQLKHFSGIDLLRTSQVLKRISHSGPSNFAVDLICSFDLCLSSKSYIEYTLFSCYKLFVNIIYLKLFVNSKSLVHLKHIKEFVIGNCRDESVTNL